MYREFLTIINEHGQEEKVKMHYGSGLISNLRDFWKDKGITVLTKGFVDFGEIDENTRTIEEVYEIMKG